MTLRAKIIVTALLVLALVAVVSIERTHLIDRLKIARDARTCQVKVSETERVNCWLAIVLQRLSIDGIDAAFRVFGYLYDTYPEFASSGCHRLAHRVGDETYYEYYVAQRIPIEDIHFPQDATTCGYGFFHGFIEHLIQQHADQEFVMKTCEYLKKTYGDSMRDIGTICYHASGHGFIQAEGDHLPKNEWGNAEAIIARPLNRCESLPISERDREECREGVFNVLVDWAKERGGQFGLSFDINDPFKICRQVLPRWQYGCLYEFGQNVGELTQTSPLKAAEFVETVPDPQLRNMTFGVMVAVMMQTQAPLNGYESILSECMQLNDPEFYKRCVISSANGMMEHGSPGKEYEKVLTLCATPKLKERGGDAYCWDTLARRLSRFYPSQKKAEICTLFPKDFVTSCDQIP